MIGWPDLVELQPFSSEQAGERVICGGWFLWTPVRSSEQVLQPGVLAQEQGLEQVIPQMKRGSPQLLEALNCWSGPCSLEPPAGKTFL